MEIRAYIGDITQSGCDAVVNAAHAGLTGGGGVDGAIHRAAGSRLLQFCRDLPQVEKGIRCRPGEAKITPGFNLRAKYVVHTVAPKFVGSATHVPGVLAPIYNLATPGGFEDLAKCYRNCLAIADEAGCKTIAFPSLGTGGHAWPIEVACPIAIRAMRAFVPKSIEAIDVCLFGVRADVDLGWYEAEIARS